MSMINGNNVSLNNTLVILQATSSMKQFVFFSVLNSANATKKQRCIQQHFVYLLNVMLQANRKLYLSEHCSYDIFCVKHIVKKANGKLYYRTSSKLCKFMLAQKPISLQDCTLMTNKSYYIYIVRMRSVQTQALVNSQHKIHA